MIRVILPALCLVALASADIPLGAGVKKIFLDKHNGFRHATGGGQKDLSWDAGLAAYAAKRINQCKYGHDPTHKYGENLYWSTAAINAAKGAKRASEAWASEIQYIHDAPNWGCAYGATKKTCGHYTQQIWNETTKMGCAIINNCKGRKKSMVYCEYEPKGNMRYMDWNGNIVNVPPY